MPTQGNKETTLLPSYAFLPTNGVASTSSWKLNNLQKVIKSQPVQAGTVAAELLNSMPHIDDITDYASLVTLIEKDEVTPSNELYYCLPHHHFKLNANEALIFNVEEVEGRIDSVQAYVEEWSNDLYPFQYFSNGKEYVPVAFTKNISHACILDQIGMVNHVANLGIISKSIGSGAIEYTDEAKRVQVFEPAKGDEGTTIATIASKMLREDPSYPGVIKHWCYVRHSCIPGRLRHTPCTSHITD